MSEYKLEDTLSYKGTNNYYYNLAMNIKEFEFEKNIEVFIGYLTKCIRDILSVGSYLDDFLDSSSKGYHPKCYSMNNYYYVFNELCNDINKNHNKYKFMCCLHFMNFINKNKNRYDKEYKIIEELYDALQKLRNNTERTRAEGEKFYDGKSNFVDRREALEYANIFMTSYTRCNRILANHGFQLDN